MQFVQTIIFFILPFDTARTRCKFGLNRRLVTLWAWLTLFPTIGFFPHISQTLDISGAPFNNFNKSHQNPHYYTKSTPM